jgi:hypothetical protein
LIPMSTKEGSEQARLKVIGYFEQVLEHSRGSLLGEAICKRLTPQSCPFSSPDTIALGRGRLTESEQEPLFSDRLRFAPAVTN